MDRREFVQKFGCLFGSLLAFSPKSMSNFVNHKKTIDEKTKADFLDYCMLHNGEWKRIAGLFYDKIDRSCLSEPIRILDHPVIQHGNSTVMCKSVQLIKLSHMDEFEMKMTSRQYEDDMANTLATMFNEYIRRDGKFTLFLRSMASGKVFHSSTQSFSTNIILRYATL